MLLMVGEFRVTRDKRDAFMTLAARISGKRWHLFNLPEHLFFFGRPSIGRALQRSGFTDLSFHYDGFHYSLDYLVERIAKSIGLPLLNRLRFDLLAKINLPVNLFDIMTVVAWKK